MNELRDRLDSLVDKFIRVYGYEASETIEFGFLCEIYFRERNKNVLNEIVNMYQLYIGWGVSLNR